MPLRDGTGPTGNGPTGRRLGPCGNGSNNPLPGGFGQARGMGRGRGSMGRGWCGGGRRRGQNSAF